MDVIIAIRRGDRDVFVRGITRDDDHGRLRDSIGFIPNLQKCWRFDVQQEKVGNPRIPGQGKAIFMDGIINSIMNMHRITPFQNYMCIYCNYTIL